MQNFNLNMLNDIREDLPVNISGILSGLAQLKKLEGNPLITSNLVADNLIINDRDFGNTIIRADWVRDQQEIELNITSAENPLNIIDIRGFYRPRDNNIDLDFKLKDIELATFQPYLNKQLDDVNGKVNLDLAVKGKISEPNINGDIIFQNGSALVRETQTKYFFSDRLRIESNDLYFDKFEFLDIYGNQLIAEGRVSTNNFSNLFINLDLTANRFNFLATNRFNNEQFYGDVFASGIIQVNGPVDQLNIRATANTERNTKLKLPLYNAAEIQTTDFITFVKSEETPQPAPENSIKRERWVTLDMDLSINSNTSVQLIFDPKVGDIIEASGNGTLKFEIDENGDFSMFGNVLIEDGEYLFTLQNVINKRFRVKHGGNISWNGSPTSANIDLEAIYETKASTFNLAPEPTEDMKKRIPVQCLLLLQGDLTNPTITPKIYLPTAEPETRSLVETSIGTDEELMRQFISLLVINNFISSADFTASNIGGTSGGVAGITASELLSNQLSNWLSQISSDFDIGVNYRPGDAISSDEVELALSTQLLNDRIIFSGNLDVLADEVKTTSGQASNIVGDFDLEFRVSDKVSIKAFNRVNDDRVVRPSLYTQGIGLIYRSEFNKISDFFRKENRGSEEEEIATPDENGMIRNEEEDNTLP
jgi:hypothetical protein